MMEIKIRAIESLYAVLTDENGDETIAGLSLNKQFTMQAVSSRKATMEMALSALEKEFPQRKFRLVRFFREPVH